MEGSALLSSLYIMNSNLILRNLIWYEVVVSFIFFFPTELSSFYYLLKIYSFFHLVSLSLTGCSYISGFTSELSSLFHWSNRMFLVLYTTIFLITFKFFFLKFLWVFRKYFCSVQILVAVV